MVRSIAVLPLDNYSGDPGQDYFAEGMTDELTAKLATTSRLRVISHGSAMQFRGARRHLPISLVGKVTTPTMVTAGEDDLRTPMAESEQYYQALRLRRVPTALVRIPGASHAINARPSQMIAQVLNTAAWFERHRRREP